MKTRLSKLFGTEFYENSIKDKLIYLPNSINFNKFNFKQDGENNNFLCICWLNKKVIKRKNIYRLFQAIKLLENKDIKLDLIGSGDYVEQVKKWARDLKIQGQVNFLGFVKNENISKYLNSAKAFVLPSISETFGVAYIESLVSGTPILYSKNTGFDGTFADVGVGVYPLSVKSIANGISNLMEKSEYYRANIKNLNDTGAFNVFSREYVSNIYKKCLDEV
jgi:glycosyltransferase involved in cell wall biosynthesis